MIIVGVSNEENNSFVVGDIVSVDGYDSYLVVEEDEKYTLRNLNGHSIFCDTYDSLKKLVTYMQNNHFGKYKVYPHQKYGIKLIEL